MPGATCHGKDWRDALVLASEGLERPPSLQAHATLAPRRRSRVIFEIAAYDLKVLTFLEGGLGNPHLEDLVIMAWPQIRRDKAYSRASHPHYLPYAPAVILQNVWLQCRPEVVVLSLQGHPPKGTPQVYRKPYGACRLGALSRVDLQPWRRRRLHRVLLPGAASARPRTDGPGPGYKRNCRGKPSPKPKSMDPEL